MHMFPAQTRLRSWECIVSHNGLLLLLLLFPHCICYIVIINLFIHWNSSSSLPGLFTQTQRCNPIHEAWHYFIHNFNPNSLYQCLFVCYDSFIYYTRIPSLITSFHYVELLIVLQRALDRSYWVTYSESIANVYCMVDSSYKNHYGTLKTSASCNRDIQTCRACALGSLAGYWLGCAWVWNNFHFA